MERDEVYVHITRLSAITAEESLDQIITTLWRTRTTGLRSPEKSHFQSLLRVSSAGELDSVLACLRSLIRMCVRKNLTREDLLKLFPSGLSLDLQDMLVRVLQKYTSSWKAELSKKQQPLPRTTVPFQALASMPRTFPSLPSSDTSQSSASMLNRQDNHIPFLSPGHLGQSTSITDNGRGCSSSRPPPLQNYAGPPDNLRKVRRFKSINWNIENPGSKPADRVATVSLTLEDNTKQSPGETEVKFKLTRDTLEAVLRSLNHTSQKFSSMGTTSLEPTQKKHKQ